MDRLRIDKWLWAARFYKTRALAAEALDLGRISLNGQLAKPSREVKAGDQVALRRDAVTRTVIVRDVSTQRGPATVAQQLYEETADSLAAAERAAQQRRLQPEPAHALTEGRPTKRGRRDLDRLHHGWDTRWSASLDE
jgi:ribosome-associated heat shock protein Hsp15